MYPYHTLTPEGIGDKSFEDCLRREQVTKQLSDLMYHRGFRQVVTPTLEFADVFGCAAPHLALEDMYKTTDMRGRLLTLRNDATIPIARMVATTLAHYPAPLRLCYAQNVYRVEHQLRGRSHQMYQVGAELLGDCSLRSDLEMVDLAMEGLEAVGTKNYRMELCHIGYFKGIMEDWNAPEQVKEQVRQCIEEKNYPALRDVLAPFGEEPAAKALQYLPRLFGGEEVFEQAYRLFPGKKASAALQELEKLCGELRALGRLDKVIFDLGLVNQAEYYTGVIFRGYLDEVGEPVLYGGRYDNLLCEFGRAMPAIGFAYHADLVATALDAPKERRADVLVYAKSGFYAKGLQYVQALQKQGLTVEWSIFDTPEQSENYAKQRGILQLHTVGEQVTEKTIEGGANP